MTLRTYVFDAEAFRRRLRLLRKLFGENQVQFSARLGVSFKKWNHYERGYPVPRETMFIIMSKIEGMSVDWLWFGNELALPVSMQHRLRELERQEKELGEPKVGEPEHLRVIRPVPKKIGRGKRPVKTRRLRGDALPD